MNTESAKISGVDMGKKKPYNKYERPHQAAYENIYVKGS